MNEPTQLWHYTCRHSAEGIRRDGVVRPNRQRALADLDLAWFTDLDEGYRFELGLTSDFVTCDRMAHRFEVKDPSALTWWPRFARDIPWSLRDELEAGRLPAHWWVATEPVAVIT